MLKRILRRAFDLTGIGVVSPEELKILRNLDSSLLLYGELAQEQRELIAPFLPYSKSQLAQDLFALAFAKTAEPRYFVEFGATDGVSLSNTWLLEKKLGWDGILAEPAKTWHSSLKSNRSCKIDTNCVARLGGDKMAFLEVSDKHGEAAELSGIKEFADAGDWASRIRLENSREYEVETISLNDLLDKHGAPGEIQFLSLDTEGSEFEILSGYDFGNRRIHSICVEHNYIKSNRKSINGLLTGKGYRQVLRQVSKWDDWYVL